MPATFKAVLNNKPKADGSHAILIRITLDRQRKFVNTGETVKKSEFNAKKGEVRKSHLSHESINHSIESRIEQVRRRIRKKEEQGEHYTLEQIQAILQGKEEKVAPKEFIKYGSETIDLYYPEHQNLDQYKHFWTTLNSWKTFEKAEGKVYNLKDVDISSIRRFENFLITVKKNKPRTIANHLKRIKRLFRLAVDHNIIEYHTNPFTNIKINRGAKSKKPRLSMEEIKQLEQTKPIEGSVLFHAKNVWLAQFYAAGTRIGDMLAMKFENVGPDRIVFDMQKTEEEQSIPINPKLRAIIEYYRTPDKTLKDYIFPFFKKEIDYSNDEFFKKQLWSKTAQINASLKDLATMAGIDKNLTTHMARHSFADIARKKSGNIYGVSKALRHSNIRITEEYLESFDHDAVDDVMGSVFDFDEGEFNENELE